MYSQVALYIKDQRLSYALQQKKNAWHSFIYAYPPKLYNILRLRRGTGQMKLF